MSADPLLREPVGDAGDGLWRRWRVDRDASARARLLEENLGLVHHCAHALKRRAAYLFEVEELVSAGTLGLVQAVEGFDPARGLAFSTYAIPRIRGAMLDELRAHDRRPRLARSRARQVGAAAAALAQELHSEPGEEAIAAHLGISVTTLREWRRDEMRGECVPLDEPAASGSGSMQLGDVLVDPTAPAVGDGIEREESFRLLAAAFELLSEKDRLVLTLSFFENLSLREIGEVLHVTESRVSQIRTRALALLRERLREEGEPRP